MKELGVQMIPAYSPQARGRSERNFGTWQGRLPQELRLAGITTVEGANAFLRERYVAEFNAKFTVAAAQKGRMRSGSTFVRPRWGNGLNFYEASLIRTEKYRLDTAYLLAHSVRNEVPDPP